MLVLKCSFTTAPVGSRACTGIGSAGACSPVVLSIPIAPALPVLTTHTGTRGSLGIPYRAVLDFGRARYAFCKVNPPPGEQVIPDPRKIVELPRACRR